MGPRFCGRTRQVRPAQVIIAIANFTFPGDSPCPKKHSKIWKKVDSFFTDALIPADSALDAALDANRQADLPAIDVTPLQGKFLELLIRATGAQRVLELGTLGGIQHHLARARSRRQTAKWSRLNSIPHHAEIAQRNLDNAGVASRVDLRIGPASESLAALVHEKSRHSTSSLSTPTKPGIPTTSSCR